MLDIPELSLDFIADICKIDKTVLENRYNIEIMEEDVPLDILDKICESRKYVLRGGDIDYDRGSIALINDFKSGKLGNITLETIKDIKKLTKRDKLSKKQREEEEL